MLILNKLLYQLPPFEVLQGDTNIEIAEIHADSRKIQPQDVFVALKGTQADGHLFINQALTQGAKVVVLQDKPQELVPQITYIQTADTAKFLGALLSNFYGNPSEKLRIVGITGTNGKTSNATLLYRLFRILGYKVGLLSTVENKINEVTYPATLTTPQPHELQIMLARMVQEQCQFCFMECSSHAIVQERIAGVKLSGAVFTNISHDHLDFHITFDNYINAKKKLFDDLPADAFALVNLDDKRGKIMLQNCKAKVQRTFALKNFADFKGKIIENTLQGLCLAINQQEVWFKLIGDFNAYNLLSVYGTAVLLGEDAVQVLTALSEIEAPQGRFEQLISPKGFMAVVDYAHTPDALENVLKTLAELKSDKSQVITVVGCGGNRDKTKRPIMAKIACQYSDKVILTSDNPRDEAPEDILQDMLSGIKPADQAKVLVLIDRKTAILQACALAQTQDVVLVAGKGHETYQEIQGIKYPFDDREIIKEAFRS